VSEREVERPRPSPLQQHDERPRHDCGAIEVTPSRTLRWSRYGLPLSQSAWNAVVRSIPMVTTQAPSSPVTAGRNRRGRKEDALATTAPRNTPIPGADRNSVRTAPCVWALATKGK